MTLTTIVKDKFVGHIRQAEQSGGEARSYIDRMTFYSVSCGKQGDSIFCAKLCKAVKRKRVDPAYLSHKMSLKFSFCFHYITPVLIKH